MLTFADRPSPVVDRSVGDMLRILIVTITFLLSEGIVFDIFNSCLLLTEWEWVYTSIASSSPPSPSLVVVGAYSKDPKECPSWTWKSVPSGKYVVIDLAFAIVKYFCSVKKTLETIYA